MSEILGRLNATIKAQGPDQLWVDARDALAAAYQTISNLHEEITTWKRRCSEETIAWTEATKRADEAGVLANRYIDHMCDEHGMCGHDD